MSFPSRDPDPPTERKLHSTRFGRTTKPPVRLNYDKNFQQVLRSADPCDHDWKDIPGEGDINFNHLCKSVPDIVEKILEYHGIQELSTIMQTSHLMLSFVIETKTWKDWTAFRTSYQNCNKDMFPSRLVFAFSECGNLKSKRKILEHILKHDEKKNPHVPQSWPDFYDHPTLLHQSAALGYADVCELIMRNLKYQCSLNSFKERENPINARGENPIHIATKNLQEAVCLVLIRLLEVKLPTNFHGDSPLHLVARESNQGAKALSIAKTFIKYTSSEKCVFCPQNNDRETCVDVANKQLKRCLEENGLSDLDFQTNVDGLSYEDGRFEGDIDISWNREIPERQKDLVTHHVQMVKILEIASENGQHWPIYF